VPKCKQTARRIWNPELERTVAGGMKRAWDCWSAVRPEEETRMMHVCVELEAILIRFAPENASAYPVEPGATLGGLIAQLGIRKDEVMLAFVNGQPANLETKLRDKATVALCPYICGG